MAERASNIRPPSKWWLVVSAVIWGLAGASLIVAITHQTSASKPIGEGQVFVADADRAETLIATSPAPHDGVRHARNQLGVEAVSLLDGEGVVIESTSETLTGSPVSNSLLAFGISNARFAALAVTTADPIEIDGVMEWAAGSVLYQVVSPLATGDGFVLLHYDVADLLGRRAQPGTIQALTIQLLALGGIFAILGAAVFVGHARVMRRHREMAVESELLRVHSRELEEANTKLAEARGKAERALALAEEKMRIRSEFVLMINHELRTPLTSVVTGAELVRSGKLNSDERRELLDSMVAHGERLNEIIDQILAVARIENRGLSYEVETVPIEQVCVAVDARLESADLPEVDVRTDLRTLNLILTSLADNARTHGASRVDISCGVDPDVAVMVEMGKRPPNPVFFCVTDDGPGIDPHFLPRAFEKFEKDSPSSGTGLGLYMVRLMVDALDGSIGVHTSPRGTTFQIALPARVRDRVRETV